LFRLNPTLNKVGKLPKLIPSNISAPNLTELAAYINALSKAQVLPTDNAELTTALLKLGRFFELNESKIGDLFVSSVNGKTKNKYLSDVKNNGKKKEVNNEVNNEVKEPKSSKTEIKEN
jgi:hypothetical protein